MANKELTKLQAQLSNAEREKNAIAARFNSELSKRESEIVDLMKQISAEHLKELEKVVGKYVIKRTHTSDKIDVFKIKEIKQEKTVLRVEHLSIYQPEDSTESVVIFKTDEDFRLGWTITEVSETLISGFKEITEDEYNGYIAQAVGILTKSK